MELGYWDMTGFGQPIRSLLVYAGVPFTDTRFSFGAKESDPNFPNQSRWTAVKDSLGLSFPNLPFLIDSERGVRLSQSITILRYLAGRHNLKASDLVTSAQEDMLEQQLLDIRDRFFRLVHRKRRLSTEEIDKLKTDYARYFEQLERWLESSSDRLWLTGPRLSYVDFLAAEYLSWFRDFVQADCFDDRFPRLKAYMERYFTCLS
ncbi:Glutathione S-transferase, mu [Tyrophagus putrescentiae]|nr:Glutathione S-transferase, mu [Tyrophagus putrescentiae]